jgi:uncharacterized protein (DUF433 family)
METNKLNITDVVTDIRAGMDQARLVVKYGLSPQDIEAIFRRMIERGLL